MIPLEQIPPDVLRKMEAIGIELAPNATAIGEVYVDGRLLPEERLVAEVEAVYRRVYGMEQAAS